MCTPLHVLHAAIACEPGGFGGAPGMCLLHHQRQQRRLPLSGMYGFERWQQVNLSGFLLGCPGITAGVYVGAAALGACA